MKDKRIILTLKEVAEILGVSENTVFKQWKKFESKALEFGITKKGRGSKAQYIQSISDDNNKIAYDILREFLINECGFDTRTDFNKLIHYLYLITLNTLHNYRYRNSKYMEVIKITKANLISYRKKLTKAGIMQPKHLSRGTYVYMGMNNIYSKCDFELYDSFIKCIIHTAEQLIENEYNINLCDNVDYQKARDIITCDFSIEDLEGIMSSINNKNIKKDVVRDKITNIHMNNKYNILKFYKIAFFEVSKQWQEEFGIKHVKFFPNHCLSNKVKNDTVFIKMIVNAYIYIINK